jgi:Protein of unknown function (DUF3192)
MRHAALSRSVLLLTALTAGCVGSPAHETFTYYSLQSTIKEDNEKLLRMRIGMSQDDVLRLMGRPERSEGYAWGSAWLYRTAMTSGIYGTADPDFTPVVFDPAGKVIGWGRNYFTEQVRKYEINLKNQ